MSTHLRAVEAFYNGKVGKNIRNRSEKTQILLKHTQSTDATVATSDATVEMIAMNRRFFLNALACIMAYGATVSVLTPSSADALQRRVLAGVGCHPDTPMRIDEAAQGVLYEPNPFVVDAFERVSRENGAINVSQNNGGQTVGVRCYVPTDSYLLHSNMTEAHVSGYKDASNGFASYVKACYLWWTNGSYTCGPENYLASGHFNEVITLGNIWSDVNRYPMITAVLRKGDKLYGIYYRD